MIRLIWILCLSVSLTHAAKEIEIKHLWDRDKISTMGRIDSTKNDLIRTGKKQEQLNRQLSKIAKSILRAERENRRLTTVLSKLAKDREINEEKYTIAKKKIDLFQRKIQVLDETIKGQNVHFASLLINQFSLLIAMEKIEKKTVDSVVMHEIYEKYKEKNADELKMLKSKISISRKKKNEILKYEKKIKQSISQITRKRESYIKKKREKDSLLKKLTKDEAIYRRNIKELMKKQFTMQATLEKLNIIRMEKILDERAREAEINRRATARAAARNRTGEGHVAAKSFVSTTNVKQIGSSYHRDKIYRYRGTKTISPLKDAKVVKSFGTYVDPIYKLKIFNESITLKSSYRDAKVHSVLNGKVVFAGQNSMLGKVIVISHGGKLHTVYAGLSRIAPNIKVERRVKKDAVIGKIKSKLIFEATKDSKYINPIRLIQI